MADGFRGRPVLPPVLLEKGRDGPDTGEFVLEDFLTFRFLIVARAFDRDAKTVYGDRFGLSLVEWRIVAVIGSAGSATANRLAERMDYDKAHISRAVASLVERGFLSRATNDRDMRSAILRLTPEGETLHAEAMAVGRERQRALLALLKPAQRRALYEALKVFYDHLPSEDRKDFDAAVVGAAPQRSRAFN